jgi:hypothetical protein
VQGLLWRRAASPNRIERWRLIRDFRPALAGQFPDFRAPVGKGLRLDADELFLKCSCHVEFPFLVPAGRVLAPAFRTTASSHFAPDGMRFKLAVEGITAGVVSVPRTC